MNKEEILKRLKVEARNNYLRFPEGLDMESENGTLTITMTQKGLQDNMQTDHSAFEGWAIAIKAIAPKLAEKVCIRWHGMGLGTGTTYNHYRRFLYRIARFEQSYEWVEYMPLDKQAVSDLKSVISELSQWVVNYPDSQPKTEASKGEARLERQLKNCLGKTNEHSDHQLPVGLFYSEKNSNFERTPRQGSQIDLWTITGDTIAIYELKDYNNRKVGIISELMFYVNVMVDLVEDTLHFSDGAEKSKFRSFDVVYNAINSNSIHNIEGVFLTNDLHALLQSRHSEVLDLLNNNARGIKYKQMGFKIANLFEIKK